MRRDNTDGGYCQGISTRWLITAPPAAILGGGRRLVSDGEATAVARAALGGVAPNAICGPARDDRNAAIRTLRASGLSVRQVGRLTGISRGVVASIR